MGTEATALVRRPTQFVQRATQPIRDIGERLLTDVPAEESLGSKLLSGAGSILESGAEAGAGFGLMLGIGAGIGQIQNPEIRSDVNAVANTAMAADSLPQAGFLSRGFGAIKDWSVDTFNRLTGGSNPAPSQLPPQVEEAPNPATIAPEAAAQAEAPTNIGSTLQDASQALSDAATAAQDTASTAVQAGTDTIGDVVSGVLDTATAGLADATAAASEIPGIGEIIGTTFALSMLASAIYEGIKGGEEDSGPVDPTLPSFQSGI